MANPNLCQCVVDALPLHVAVIDRQGTIGYVNFRWRQFADENGAPPERDVGVGANYYSVCRRARFEEPLAQAALEGIDRVARGIQESFVLEYPCHSPWEHRWFLMEARPLDPRREQGILITHTNITGWKLAEEERGGFTRQLEERVADRTEVVRQRDEKIMEVTQQLTQAEHLERQRLAHLLHDDLQQVLVAAKMRLSSVHSDNPEIQRAEELIGESISISRSLSVQISPPVLHGQDLGVAIDWLRSHMAKEHGLVIEVQIDPATPPLPQPIRVFLFEAVRELLFNVIKHARTKRAAVRMRLLEHERISLVVEDRGAGFDPTLRQDRGAAHFGISSIEQRIANLGGEMQIESAPGRGTRITLLYPRGQEPR